MIKVISLEMMLLFLMACSTLNKGQEIKLVEYKDCSENARATSYEMNICASEKAFQSSLELTNLLIELQENLPVEYWTQLEANQVKWEELREENCRLIENLFAGGSIAPMQYQYCINAENARRIQFIRGYICLYGRYPHQPLNWCEPNR
ncbi:MAG: DUF1311 domain-containing protein [Anaerolineae bacterium]|nr:DUF1311 domain-containing protein [Anaerolineae bacterium]